MQSLFLHGGLEGERLACLFASREANERHTGNFLTDYSSSAPCQREARAWAKRMLAFQFQEVEACVSSE